MSSYNLSNFGKPYNSFKSWYYNPVQEVRISMLPSKFAECRAQKEGDKENVTACLPI